MAAGARERRPRQRLQDPVGGVPRRRGGRAAAPLTGCSRQRGGCSSPSWACARRPRVAASRSRRSHCDRRLAGEDRPARSGRAGRSDRAVRPARPWTVDPAAGTDHQPARLRRRPRRASDLGGQHARCAGRARLGSDAGHSPRDLVLRARCRRRHGYRPARHGPGLAWCTRADPAQWTGGVGRRRDAGLRCGHRSPGRRRPAVGAWCPRRDHRRLSRAGRGGARRGCHGDPDGLTGAGRGGRLCPGLSGRLPGGARRAGPTGHPALARRHVRPGVDRLLGLDRHSRGHRDLLRAADVARREDRRRQGFPARRRPRDRPAAAICRPVSGCTPATTSTIPS